MKKIKLNRRFYFLLHFFNGFIGKINKLNMYSKFFLNIRTFCKNSIFKQVHILNELGVNKV